MHNVGPSRRGITLLEVLIAIGILAIGLSSVVALVPAGRSQAARAVLLDRAAGLAANVLADAATFGVLREGAMDPPPVPGALAIIDPAVLANAYSPFASQPPLRTAGVFSGPSNVGAPLDFHRLFTQGRDDLELGDPSVPDGLPIHFFVQGTRAYQGRMTALLAVQPPNPSATPPTTGVLSAVLFHNRDPSVPTVDGFLLSGVTLTLSVPAGRTFVDLVKPGVVIHDGTRFHQLKSAATREVGGAFSAFVTLSKSAPPVFPAPITLFPDSVGLAERMYTPETGGAYMR